MAPLVDYEADEAKLSKFITDFVDNSGPRYMVQLQEIANRTRRCFDLYLDDLERTDDDLAHKMSMNTKRYTAVLGDAVDKNLPKPSGDEVGEEDVYDVICRARENAAGEQDPNPARCSVDMSYVSSLDQRTRTFTSRSYSACQFNT